MEQRLLSVERRLAKVEDKYRERHSIEEWLSAVEHRLVQLEANFVERWKDMTKVANVVKIEVEKDIERARQWRESQTETQEELRGHDQVEPVPLHERRAAPAEPLRRHARTGLPAHRVHLVDLQNALVPQG